LVFGNYSLFNAYARDNDIQLLKFLLAIINSKLLTYYALKKEIILVKPGKTPQVRSGQRGPIGIHQLPIKLKEVDKTLFSSLVDKILSVIKSEDYQNNESKQAEVKKLEAQIDQMVYKLFGLTAAEITIVEKSS
jgi:adenine-specific DNA-methyltransferase